MKYLYILPIAILLMPIVGCKPQKSGSHIIEKTLEPKAHQLQPLKPETFEFEIQEEVKAALALSIRYETKKMSAQSGIPLYYTLEGFEDTKEAQFTLPLASAEDKPVVNLEATLIENQVFPSGKYTFMLVADDSSGRAIEGIQAISLKIIQK